MSIEYSLSPDGEKFTLPTKEDYKVELKRLKALVKKHKKLNREIVVVM